MMNGFLPRDRVDMPTILLFLGCLALWLVALMLPLWLGVPFLILALVLHSSLSHEILHGHPFARRRWNDALGMVQPGLFVPYLRFKRLHLEHHRDSRLTDPYDDPESNYLDPADWARLPRWRQSLYWFNNTLLGRMMIGPVIGTVAFVRGDIARITQGDRQVLRDWVLHLPGACLVLWLVSQMGMPIWVYLIACYGALSVLKIRTFCEHRAHEASGARTVIIEDRGLLSFLFLNNNLHVVHHQHPQVAWYDLPGVYRARKEAFQARNEGYVLPSYAAVFRAFFWRAKDPVAHPLWRRDKASGMKGHV